MSNRIGILIGRFQPFHNEHLNLVLRALDEFDKLIIVIGSGRQDRSFKNPFHGFERRDCIGKSVPKAALGRIRFIIQTDYPGNNPKWVAEIQQRILEENLGDDAEFFITGHKKDETSFYVDIFPWPFVPLSGSRILNATDIRKSYFSGESINKWGKDLPLPVVEFMVQFKVWPIYVEGSAAFKIIQMEMT